MNQQKPLRAKLQISKDGPYLVNGDLPLAKQTIATNAAGDSIDWSAGSAYPSQSQYALCRCGRSSAKPFCDGSHKKAGFGGTETASREPYRSQAKVMRGPSMSLSDAEGLCAFARFCDPNGQVWNQVNQTDNPAARRHFVKQTGECPLGTLGGLG
jgi:CDGSH-type Zn-finger protein